MHCQSETFNAGDICMPYSGLVKIALPLLRRLSTWVIV